MESELNYKQMLKRKSQSYLWLVNILENMTYIMWLRELVLFSLEEAQRGLHHSLQLPEKRLK